MKLIKKLFGGINLTWGKLIIFAVVAGVYTAIVAMLPVTKDTSFRDIAISFERWVLFGVFIIMNSRTPLDSGLKCFVFFLISQPLVYLIQVPFSPLGWQILDYYKNWVIWTLLTFPMGFIGHYLKRNKWWGLFIIVPVMAFLGFDHLTGFVSVSVIWFPHHIISVLFCVATIILYPFAVFENKQLQRIGAALAAAIVIASVVIGVVNRSGSVYKTTLFTSAEPGEKRYFDGTYTVSIANGDLGEVYITYDESYGGYVVNAEFRKYGETKLTLTSPEGESVTYDLTVGNNTYNIDLGEEE